MTVDSSVPSVAKPGEWSLAALRHQLDLLEGAQTSGEELLIRSYRRTLDVCPELPCLRQECRRVLGVADVTNATLARLTDLLCVEHDLTQQELLNMPLSEALAILKSTKK